jgi:putative tricarboxylic transport membrane protein|tara:strand:- start:2488 stop:2976 length:489 start_codon:yes stop_codon:yes gene_type:complete
MKASYMIVFINNTRLVGLLFLLLSGAYVYFAGEIPLDFWSEDEVFNARSMPYLIGAGAMVCSLLLILLPSAEFKWRELQNLNWQPLYFILPLISLYGYTLEILGFIVASCLLLFIAFGMLGERRWLRMTGIAAGLVLMFWLLLDSLGIYLAPGALFWSLFDA